MISRLGRLMLFRVLIVTVLMLGMVLSNYVMGTSWRLDHPYARLLMGTVVFQFLASIVYGLSIRRVPNLTVFFYVQLCIDLATISLVVHLTGGAASGFSGLYIIAVVAAAVVDLRRGAVLAGIGSVVSFLSVSFAGYMKILPALTGQKLPPWEMMPEDLYKNLGINVAAFAAVALLSSYLAEQLRSAGRRAKAHKEAFLDLSAHHQDILRRLDSGIISTNEENRILTVNRAAERICAIRAESSINKPLDAVLPQLARVQGSGRLTLPNQQGEKASVEVTATRMESVGGRSQGRVILIQDRTEFERMEEEVRRAERLAMLGRFAAGVAHEIRNPLASISGSIELLKSTHTNGEHDSELMDIVLREVERLDQLIGELLEFTRPAPLRTRPVDLAAAVKEATQLFLKEKNRADLKIEIAAPDPVRTTVDASKFSQLLWNLLRNAADVTPPNGTIKVTVARDSTSARVEVTDQGPGIKPEHQEKIFEPFFTTKPNGTGLGLATVHQIVSDHNGRIQVRSEPEGGSTFVVSLPANETPKAKRPPTNSP